MSTGTTGVYVYQQICKTSEEWAADTSIFPENIWLFERKSNGDIVTKLSDGEKPYSQLREYGLSAYISAKIGGYTGTEQDFYTLIGTIDRIAEEVAGNVRKPVHKSITVEVEDWVLEEDKWITEVSDENIKEGCILTLITQREYQFIADEAEIYTEIMIYNSKKKFKIWANNQPNSSIKFNYVIQY